MKAKLFLTVVTGTKFWYKHGKYVDMGLKAFGYHHPVGH